MLRIVGSYSQKRVYDPVYPDPKKVVWVHFLSTSFEDAEGWALTYTGSGPELVHFGPLLGRF